jgi:starch phosphorylase
MNPERYLPRSLPSKLKGLTDLALDLRWNWNHSADVLWQKIDPELWKATNDPWLILESSSRKRLETLAADASFVNELQRQFAYRKTYLSQSSWFDELYGDDTLGTVAYFSMEFGLSEALPIYSGGLGIVAGDFLKTASDLGIPLVGIGLLYQQGYFRQVLDMNGGQLAFSPYNNPTMLPVLPLQGPDGEWLRISVELPGRTLQLRGWLAQVGRVPLYLLDSNDLLNAPGDRGITAELYGGGTEMRLQQEIVLGIGGWRLLEMMNISPSVCHLNEGHAAFVVLERARSWSSTTGHSPSLFTLPGLAMSLQHTHQLPRGLTVSHCRS